MALPTPSKHKKLAPYILLCGFALFFIWWRAGIVPAASGGDEVWWSDSGYFLQKEGSLRWGIMDDDRGSGTQSFWPPVLPIIQAGFFAVCGLTPFSMCAQSALHCSLMFLLVGLLVRQYGGSLPMALAAAVGVMAPFSAERQLTQVRMESMTAVGCLAFLWMLNAGMARKSKSTSILLLMGSGASLSVGLLSYYPHSPFLLLGAMIALALCRRWNVVLFVILGSLPLGLRAVAWVLGSPKRFAAQVLATGTDHYFSLAHTFYPFRALVDWSQPITSLVAIEAFAALAVGVCLAARSRDNDRRRLGALCACMVLPVFVYYNARPVAAVALALVWLFGIGWGELRGKLGKLLSVLRLVLPWAGFAKVALLMFTAVYQAEGRDYRNVASELGKLDFSKGGVAISQRAWLGLRERVEADRLHFLVYSGASLDNMPTRAKGPASGSYFSHLVLESDRLESLAEIYPWLGPALKSGEFQKVAEIRPHFRPLPWAKEPCYHLIVYSRTQPPPAATTVQSQ